jgi:hypothetical protein
MSWNIHGDVIKITPLYIKWADMVQKVHLRPFKNAEFMCVVIRI